MRVRRGRTAARLALLGAVAAGPALYGGTAAAGAAGAGGVGAAADAPDLAMIVGGGGGQPTSVRSGEPRFARLWQLLEPMYTGTERVPEAWVEGRHPPVRITVVWG